MSVTQSNISTSELSSIEVITHSAEQICAVASDAGLFIPDEQDPAGIARVRKAAQSWLMEVERRLSRLTPGEALRVVNLYDVIHRIAWSRPADRDIINRYSLAAFEAFVRGDKAVDKYILFRLIAAGIRRKDRAYMDRPLQWYALTLDKWHKEFSTGTASLPLSDHDTRERVSILLQSDLWAYETRNEAAYKHKLFTKYQHLFTHETVSCAS